LYEIQGSFYYNPDVIADVTDINFEQIGKDLVQVSGVTGERGIPNSQYLSIALYPVSLFRPTNLQDFLLLKPSR